MKPGRVLTCMIVVVSAVAAHAGLVLGPQYRFEAGTSARAHIAARIDDVQMGSGVPLAVTGNAEVDVTYTVREVGEDGVATIVADFGPVTGELLGQAQNSPPPTPIELRVDALGRPVGAAGGEGMNLNVFAGGIPVQLVVLLAAVAELPTEPVAPGEAWSVQSTQEAPEIGAVNMTSSSRLVAIDEQGVTLATDVSARFPDFTAPNPLQGGEVTVRNAVLTVEGMERRLDAVSGLTHSAQATMRIDCTASMGGLAELPLIVDLSFIITPLEPAGQTQASAPEVAPARPAGPTPAPVTHAPAPPTHPVASTAAWLARTIGAWVGDALATIGKHMGRL